MEGSLADEKIRQRYAALAGAIRLIRGRFSHPRGAIRPKILGFFAARYLLGLQEGRLEAAMSKAKLTDRELVLIVDDDSLVRESLAELLDAKGYSVLQAENGQNALQVLKKTPRSPCLVVLDLAMPVMDGRGFLKLRAEDPILRNIPVVVVSGNVQSPEQLPGIDAYLPKPVKVARLIEIIDRHC
jgi:CheY-like chemotaxis protein